MEYDAYYVGLGLNDPARLKFNAVLDFYEETFHWAETGLSGDFADFKDNNNAEEIQMDDLLADLANLMTRADPDAISDTEMMDLQYDLTSVATNILGPNIVETEIGGFNLLDPLNSPPEVVSFEASAEWVANGPFLQVEMTGTLVVNDIDRLSDLDTVDIKYSTNGGNTFTPLGLSWMTDSGSIQATAAIPGLNPGQSFVCRGFVKDNAGETAYVDITLLPTGPF